MNPKFKVIKAVTGTLLESKLNKFAEEKNVFILDIKYQIGVFGEIDGKGKEIYSVLVLYTTQRPTMQGISIPTP